MYYRLIYISFGNLSSFYYQTKIFYTTVVFIFDIFYRMRCNSLR